MEPYMTRTLKVSLASVLLVFLASGTAYADGDSVPSNTVRVGVYYIHYHSSADDLSGPYVPSGVNLAVEDVQTLYLAYVRRLSVHFDAELALGIPPLTKTDGRGPALLGSVPYNGQVISAARWLAPTVLLNYKFFDDSAPLRPYIGIGVNYVNFYDRRSTEAGSAASGGPTSISLPSSWGPAGTVGLRYQLPGHWSFYASYSMSMVNSRLTANTAGVIRTSEIHFGPQALVFAVGYSF
jgi:outer membrane protein